MQAPCVGCFVGGGWLIRNAGYFGSEPILGTAPPGTNSDYFLGAPTPLDGIRTRLGDLRDT